MCALKGINYVNSLWNFNRIPPRCLSVSPSQIIYLYEKRCYLNEHKQKQKKKSLHEETEEKEMNRNFWNLDAHICMQCNVFRLTYSSDSKYRRRGCGYGCMASIWSNSTIYTLKHSIHLMKIFCFFKSVSTLRRIESTPLATETIRQFGLVVVVVEATTTPLPIGLRTYCSHYSLQINVVIFIHNCRGFLTSPKILYGIRTKSAEYVYISLHCMQRIERFGFGRR